MYIVNKHNYLSLRIRPHKTEYEIAFNMTYVCQRKKQFRTENIIAYPKSHLVDYETKSYLQARVCVVLALPVSLTTNN